MCEKRCILSVSLAIMLCCATTNVSGNVVDKIYYVVTSIDDKEVSVTTGTGYSGDIIIPSTTEIDNVTYTVTGIGDNAFIDATLTSIVIPETVTKIGSAAFLNCTLPSITIPKSVNSIGSAAFRGCTLASITIPEGVNSIEHHTFYGCSNLASISIPESVTEIAEYAFVSCSSLTSVTLPKGLSKIENCVFYRSGLVSISIPESVTGIGTSSFAYCSNLATVVLPESLQSIDAYSFDNCTKLKTMYCYALEPPTTGIYVFDFCDLKNATLHVPSSAIEDYKTTAPWRNFGTIMAIEPASETVTINQYGNGTFCSDESLDFSEVEGLKAYAATGCNTTTGVVTLTRVMTAKAGVGLFVKGEPGEYNVPVIESSDDIPLNMLVGTLESTAVNSISGDGIYANYKYTILEGDAAPMFYQFADGSTLSAGKAYLQIPVAWLPTGAKSISLRFDDGGTTDVEEMENLEQSSDFIYDLLGRRVTTPQRGSLYLINGKKFIY